MNKTYVSPKAIKVNFEANDIITASGVMTVSNWSGWNTKGIMSITWDQLINSDK